MSDSSHGQNLLHVQQQQLGPQLNSLGQQQLIFHHGQQNQAQTPSRSGSVDMPSNTRDIILHNPSLPPHSGQVEPYLRYTDVPSTVVTPMSERQQQQADTNGQSGQNHRQPPLRFQPAVYANRGLLSGFVPVRASGSIPHQQLEGGVQPNAQVLPARRPMTFAELSQRAAHLRTFITRLETTSNTLQNNRAAIEPSQFTNQMLQLTAEIRTKKELLAKVIQLLNQMAARGENDGTLNGSQEVLTHVASDGPSQVNNPQNNNPTLGSPDDSRVARVQMVCPMSLNVHLDISRAELTSP